MLGVFRRSKDTTASMLADLPQSHCELCGHQASDVADMKQRHDAARLGVLIYQGVEPIDLAGTVGVVSVARRVLPAVEATVIARHAGPVRLAGGLTVLASHGVDTAPAPNQWHADASWRCGRPTRPMRPISLRACLAESPRDRSDDRRLRRRCGCGDGRWSFFGDRHNVVSARTNLW